MSGCGRSNFCGGPSMATPALARDFKEFLKLLNSNHIEYLLIGGRRTWRTWKICHGRHADYNQTMDERETLRRIRRREIRDADNLKVLAMLESAFNHATRTLPPRPSSGMVDMQK